MKDASNDIQIKWYTTWQEVVENSLYEVEIATGRGHNTRIHLSLYSLCKTYLEDDLD
jgi:23S rRNA-/tRNA-specific pseudouridylate synthase